MAALPGVRLQGERRWGRQRAHGHQQRWAGRWQRGKRPSDAFRSFQGSGKACSGGIGVQRPADRRRVCGGLLQQRTDIKLGRGAVPGLFLPPCCMSGPQGSPVTSNTWSIGFQSQFGNYTLGSLHHLLQSCLLLLLFFWGKYHAISFVTIVFHYRLRVFFFNVAFLL